MTRASQIFRVLVARGYRSAEFIPHRATFVNRKRNKFRAPEKSAMRTPMTGPRSKTVPTVGRQLLVLMLLKLAVLSGGAEAFLLPTANRALFETGQEERFFVGTVGKTWTSGTFGCVRSSGQQLHEGLDIKCLQRDKKGEPTDPVMAAADGTVAYINTHPGLSNYGQYLVLRHRVDGLEVYSLYAHLREIRSGLQPGKAVKAGETVAVMGHTTGTRERISKERAHVHFELNLLLNDRFAAWHRKTFPGQRNDHGNWNGQNLVGLDPLAILQQHRKEGAAFSLLNFVRHQTELCRVLVRQTQFPWVRRYPALIRRNLLVEKEGIAGYEITLNYCGIPFALVPRAPSEVKSQARFQLLSVNDAEQQQHPCRHLVAHQGKNWTLTQSGQRLLDLITY